MPVHLILCSVLLLFSSGAMAQWAVYDKKIHEQLQYINQIRGLESASFTNLDKAYKNRYGSEGGNDGAHLTLGDGDSKTVLKGLDTKFDELTDLSDDEKKKYIGTLQDCGDDKVNPAHYQACAGLRNLRLQTLKQS